MQAHGHREQGPPDPTALPTLPRPRPPSLRQLWVWSVLTPLPACPGRLGYLTFAAWAHETPDSLVPFDGQDQARSLSVWSSPLGTPAVFPLHLMPCSYFFINTSRLPSH